MRELTYSKALREALTEEMARNPDILLLGEDIGVYGGVFKVTEGLLAQFGPERVIETPISEAGFVGAAVGLAMTGKHPVVELMFMDFAYVAADSIFNQAAKMRYMSGGRAQVPLLIRTQQGGGRGNAAQHSQSLETFFTHIPGLKVVLPATPYDAKGLLKSALRDPNPVVFIEHKLLYNTKGPVPEDEYFIPLGQADVKRAGKDATVVSLVAHRAARAGSGRAGCPGGHRRRGDRPALHRAAGHRHGGRIGQEDRPPGGRPRGAPPCSASAPRSPRWCRSWPSTTWMRPSSASAPWISPSPTASRWRMRRCRV